MARSLIFRRNAAGAIDTFVFSSDHLPETEAD
jgi:hypothetical protein